MRPWAIKRDIDTDKEGVTYFDGQTDRRTNPVIEMGERKSNISNEFRYIFCAVDVTFSTFHESVTDRRTDGRTDRRTDGHTLL